MKPATPANSPTLVNSAVQVAVFCGIAFLIHHMVFAKVDADVAWRAEARLKDANLQTTSTNLRLVRKFGKSPSVDVLLNIEGRWLRPDCAGPEGRAPAYLSSRSFLHSKTPPYEEFTVEAVYNRNLLSSDGDRIDLWSIKAPDAVKKVWGCGSMPSVSMSP